MSQAGKVVKDLTLFAFQILINLAALPTVYE
jgi:hypothetical protein